MLVLNIAGMAKVTVSIHTGGGIGRGMLVSNTEGMAKVTVYPWGRHSKRDVGIKHRRDG